jgi:hypothetical protein
MLAKGFLEQRHQLDDPPVHGRVIDLNTVFRNHLFEITQTQRIGHVPAHTSQDHVQRKVQPVHNFGHARRQRLARNPFLLHRRFWQIFHPKILPLSLSRQNQKTSSPADMASKTSIAGAIFGSAGHLIFCASTSAQRHVSRGQ